MSTILWVEDFGGTGGDKRRLVLIKELLGNDVEYPEDILDNKATREFLKKHNILLAVTVDEALTQIQKSDAFDFVVLDVDVPKSALLSYENPETIKKLETREIEWLEANDSEYLNANENSKDTKLENSLKINAGFHLAMYLVLDKGFPRSHIVFFSAHGDWYYSNDNQSALQRSFIGARMGKNPFHFFLKSDANKSGTLPTVQSSGSNSETNNKEEIFEWIDTRRQREKGYDYFILRRGIIDACNILKKSDQKDENGNAKGEILHDLAELRNGMAKTLEIQDFNDRLHELKNILPCRVPEDKKNLLKRLARTVVHQWDKNKQGEYRDILQTARNWLAHGDMEISEKDVAFLFVLHMRSISNEILIEYPLIEKSFLSLFESSKLPSNLDDLITKSYHEMKTEYKKVKECKEYLCKQLYLYEKNRYIDFVKSYQAHREHTHNSMPDMKYLYRSFFHQFLGRKDQKVSKEVFDDEEMKAYAQAWIKLADF